MSRVGWCAWVGHQMSLFICLSTWLIVCCWCHVLSCLLSDPALLVIALLFQSFHLCPPRLSPHIFSRCLQSCADLLFYVVCLVCLHVLQLSCCLSVFPPRGGFCYFCFFLLLKTHHSPALESSPHLSSTLMTIVHTHILLNKNFYFGCD